MNTELLATWAGNFSRNTSEAFSRLTLKDYIRLIIIMGGYALLRPYIMKIGAKLQMRQHEKDAATGMGEIHPNELRGKVEIPGLDEETDDEDDESAPADWGRTARVRQRKFIREALEKEEQRLREQFEAEDDKDIAEYLVD
jgi:hypothetical protein